MAFVKIRLEKVTAAKDGSGDWKETITKYNLWAEVLSGSSGRSSLNGRTTLNATKQFKVRFRPDFKPEGNWRIVYDAKKYTVNSIEKENEKRFYWIITAEALGN